MNRLKVKRLALSLAGLLVSLLLVGCATLNQNRQPMAQPADIPESAGVSASAEPGTQWVHGYWQWDGHSWVWASGYWE